MAEDTHYIEQIRLAQNLLRTVRHASYATVNEDGTPHNSPLMLIYNDDLTKLYIGTFSAALHTRNLVRTGNTFAVIYDSFTKSQGGVYITGINAHECQDNELVEALRVHNEARARHGSRPLELQRYQAPKPAQRMYAIDIQRIEIYSSLRSEEGLIISETRMPVDREVLVEGITRPLA